MTPSPHVEIEVQARDLAILRGLFDSRLATIYHLSTLHFSGRLEAARKRVQKLKAAGVLHERRRKATEPSVYCLTKKAFTLLEQSGSLAEHPAVHWASLEKRARISPLTLQHEMEVMDCKTALTAASQRSGCTLVEFSTWPRLFEFNARNSAGRNVLVRPDAFIRVQAADRKDAQEATFYLELDRSTEPQHRLAERAACYRDFYLQGGLARRWGRPQTEFKRFPFIVLMIFKTAERRNNTAERLLQIVPPIRNQVWLSTLGDFTRDPLGAIWVKPTEYARLTGGTPFDPHLRRNFNGYRRQPQREAFVEPRLGKHRLLADVVGRPAAGRAIGNI